MTFEDFITSPGRGGHRPDDIITLDIFDIANILTDALRERQFLAPYEGISVYDLEPAMEACGYYLTVERKDGKIKIRRSAR